MATTRQKTVLFFPGLGVMAVLAFAGLHWRDLAVRYYLRSLERNGDPLLDYTLLEEPRDTVRREALEQFVQTPKGKENLVRTYLLHAADLVSALLYNLKTLEPGGDGVFYLVWVDDQVHHRQYFERPGGEIRDRGHVAHATTDSGTFAKPPAPFARALQELLIQVRFDRFPLPEQPEITLSILPMSPDPRFPRSFGGSLLGSAPYTCLFARKGSFFPNHSRGSE